MFSQVASGATADAQGKIVNPTSQFQRGFDSRERQLFFGFYALEERHVPYSLI